ncbi:hypothetical protein Golax_016669 [Gossypium laxum]|uniref:RNA-binding S4 domain-containing protein n=1 Tax=Gossypium laxum TaxID=34288 RepID=A0A7J8YXW2_9ROSI|nr:hypothetical protein [Gossypium laxum]
MRKFFLVSSSAHLPISGDWTSEPRSQKSFFLARKEKDGATPGTERIAPRSPELQNTGCVASSRTRGIASSLRFRRRNDPVVPWKHASPRRIARIRVPGDPALSKEPTGSSPKRASGLATRIYQPSSSRQTSMASFLAFQEGAPVSSFLWLMGFYAGSQAFPEPILRNKVASGTLGAGWNPRYRLPHVLPAPWPSLGPQAGIEKGTKRVYLPLQYSGMYHGPIYSSFSSKKKKFRISPGPGEQIGVGKRERGATSPPPLLFPDHPSLPSPSPRPNILHPPASSRGGSIPVIRDVAKKTEKPRYEMPALRFKTCRLLSGNVRNRELTIIQRRILRRLRNNKRSIKKKIYTRKNRNSYIQSQTTRKLPLFHGDLPITEMHRGTERASYIPFPLNPETRSDVIPVRLHFRETIPQARQLISHRRVCVNNEMVKINHLKLSHGDIISFQENNARIRGEEIRRSFYIEISVRMWRRIKCFHLIKTKRGCRLLLKKSRFLKQLRSYMQEEDLKRTKKFGSEKVCLASSFAEHNRMKRNLYFFKSLFLWNEKNRNLPTQTRSPIVYNSFLYRYSNSTYCSAFPYQKKKTMKRRIKRIELPTHYSEVNHRTLKAVVSYGPNIGHIPHDIRLKDPNLPLRSGNGRGQNI